MGTSGSPPRAFSEGSPSVLLGGRFQKHRWIERQGAVQNWQGLDLSTGTPVVLKIAPLHALQSGAFERMMREDAVLRDLRSSRLSAPLHSGLEGEELLRVVPCTPKGTLETRRMMGPLSVQEALQLGQGLLRALREAHAVGVLHRHLTPRRVVIDPEQPLHELTLIDFGLALEDLRESSLGGLPPPAFQYLSPEQLGLVDSDVGPASDLYAVGVVLFECLAGIPPFQGATLGEFLQKHFRTVPELRAQGLRIPRALEQMIQHLLREDPRERYQSAEAALSDLEAIASQLERGIAEPVVVVGRSDHHPSVTEPSFIGQATELRELERALSAASQGQGGLVLLEGESGAGKTMLLDELERRGLARGARIFRGQGIDRAAARPLQTLFGVFEALGSVMETIPVVAERLRAISGTRLGAALASSPRLREALKLPAPATSGPMGPPEHCVMHGLAAVIEALGDRKAPALVLLDDCQWSDRPTLKLLSLLGQPAQEASGPERFVTVVAAFRKEEVPEDHPLRQLSALHRVSLEPFTPSDLRDLAESMAGPVPNEALDIVTRISEGNPFMAAAMVRGLVECGALTPGPSGWCVEPERLAEVRSSRRAASWLLRRLEPFSEETRHLLSVGALLGREFEVELTAALARQPPEQARAALEQARQRHLLWAHSSEGRYTFAHDRIRDALLEQLPAEESRALHLAAALELARRSPDRSFELAWHFEAARELERAWPHALKSAEAARREHALDLAERYYRLADAGATSADDATRMAILEGLGDVLRVRVRLDEAERCYTRAQAFAVTRLDRARLEGRRGATGFGRLDMPNAIASTENALQLLGCKVPGSSLSLLCHLVWVLLVHALRPLRRGRRSRPLPPLEGETLLATRLYLLLPQICWIHTGSLMTGVWAHLQGLRIAERHAPTPELAAAYAGHGGLLLALPSGVPWTPSFVARLTLARGRKYFQRALELREAFGDAFEHGFTLYLYQYALFNCARYEESIEAGQHAGQLFRESGASSDTRSHFGDTGYYLGLARYLVGDLTGAVRHGQHMYQRGKEVGDGLLCSTSLELWACASEGLLPAELLTAERAHLVPKPGNRIAAIQQAYLLHAEGRRLLRVNEPEQAAATFEQAIQQMQAARLRFRFPLCRLKTLLARALREQAARVPSYTGTLRAALLHEARALLRMELHHPLPFRENLVAPYRELGLIAATEGRNAQARRYFARSLAIAERLSMRYEQALTLQARAKVGAALGWSDAPQDAATAEELLRPMREVLEPAPAVEAQASLSLVDRFPRILEVGRSIASALTRDAIFSVLREGALGLLRGESCALIEATPEGLRLTTHPCNELWPFIYRARESRRPVVPTTEELDSTVRGPERSALCAPILVRGEVVALFCVTNHKLAGAFGPQELRIAEFLATLAGAALENAQNFAEVNALSAERERLYQEAQVALRKRDEFLAVASHELRTPFTPMRIYMQGLLNALRDPARAAGLQSWVTKLETANARLQRLAKLVEELFDVSRLSQGKLALRQGEIDLAALTAEAVDRWKDELARAQCSCTLEAPAPVIGHWDALRLEQVIDNLLGNATKYSPGQPISLSVKSEGTLARLTVQDRGMGIPPEDQARIFERFERAVSENYGGFGLGLWISREVVQAHGGRITVESTPGQGATFTVELPVAGMPA